MRDAIQRESPLARFGLAARTGHLAVRPQRAVGVETHDRANANVAIDEQPFLGHIDVRGSLADSSFVGAVRDTVGVAPPDVPNTVVEANGNVVYWLGPDEWLIVTLAARQAELERNLRNALRDTRSAVTDVSGGQTIIVIGGAMAREVLAKGCPLDLHARAFGVGQCAQSHLAKAAILLRNVDAAPTFEIVVRRSYADYIWLWLNDAAAEYRVEAEP